MRNITCVGVVAIAVSVLSARGQEEGSWTDKVSLGGDMRLRYEYIDQDGSDSRDRLRIRLRVGLEAELNEDIDMYVGLATNPDDPVSSNVTLGDGFTGKDFGLDLAYLDWHPAAVEGLQLWLGKTKNSFATVEDLVFDDDLHPEGAMARYTAALEPVDLFANLGYWYAQERSTEDETAMIGGQFGGEAALGERATLLAAAAYYYWDNMQGFEPLFDETDGFGNTLVDTGTAEEPAFVYANDYGVAEALAQLDLDTGRLPLSLFANYIVNTEADSDGDTGWLVGLSLGKAKAPGSFAAGYNYRDLEADATVGAYADSDVFGGGTNGRGHEMKLAYQLNEVLQVAGTAFYCALDPDGEDTDYTRFQLDLKAAF